MLLMTVAVVIVIFCLSFSAPARETENEPLADENDILDHENRLWQSLMGPKIDTSLFEQSIAPGYVAILPSGETLCREENVAFLKQWSMHSVRINNPQVRSLSANSALIVYQVTLDGSHYGRQVDPLRLDVSSMWVKRADKWMLQMHAETETPSRKPLFRSETFGELVDAVKTPLQRNALRVTRRAKLAWDRAARRVGPASTLQPERLRLI